MSLLDAGGNCLPTDWNSADDQKNLILLTVTGLYTTAFWQYILSWHTRHRKNSCLCSLHERSRVPSPSALLLKHYLTAEDFKVIFFSPRLNCRLLCISVCYSHHHGHGRLIDSVLVDPCGWFSIHTVTPHNNTPSIAEVLSWTLAYWSSGLSLVPLQSHRCVRNKLSEL